MRGRSKAWAKGTAALAAWMTALTFAAPPCSAADARTSDSPRTSTERSLAASAEARLAAAPMPRLAQDASAGATASGGSSFFRSPKGVAAIVLMVAGAAYVGYRIPKDNEKVHSPIR